MSDKNLSENLTELTAIVKSYLETYTKLLKVELLEKLAKCGTLLFSSIVLLLISMFVLFFLCFSFSYWYGETYGSFAIGFLISAGFYVLLGLTVCLFRKPLIGGRIIRSLSAILFNQKSNEDGAE
jgi:uncharacterized membrane protein YqjE